ncbi:MAG: hypothetical protein HQL03_13930 [Nitrospirae bacterium]|nr:hypothetical protein [Nitrospirota bacterium]
MKIKKHLSFGALLRVFSAIIENFQDYRQKGKIQYSIHNVFMSAFAMMFFQEPSMLQFQRNLEKQHRRNNIRTLFKVDSIPEDNQIRNVLDNVDSNEAAPVFNLFGFNITIIFPDWETFLSYLLKPPGIHADSVLNT